MRGYLGPRPNGGATAILDVRGHRQGSPHPPARKSTPGEPLVVLGARRIPTYALRVMRETLQTLVGELTGGEVTLVAFLFVTIVAFSWLPRLGEVVGGWFDRGSE